MTYWANAIEKQSSTDFARKSSLIIERQHVNNKFINIRSTQVQFDVSHTINFVRLFWREKTRSSNWPEKLRQEVLPLRLYRIHCRNDAEFIDSTFIYRESFYFEPLDDKSRKFSSIYCALLQISDSRTDDSLFRNSRFYDWPSRESRCINLHWFCFVFLQARV